MNNGLILHEMIDRLVPKLIFSIKPIQTGSSATSTLSFLEYNMLINIVIYSFIKNMTHCGDVSFFESHISQISLHC